MNQPSPSELRQWWRAILVRSGIEPYEHEAGGLGFEHEGTTIWLVPHEDDPKVLALIRHIPFRRHERTHPAVIARCNAAALAAASTVLVAKIVRTDSEIFACVETWVMDEEAAMDALPRAIDACMLVGERYIDYRRKKAVLPSIGSQIESAVGGEDSGEEDDIVPHTGWDDDDSTDIGKRDPHEVAAWVTRLEDIGYPVIDEAPSGLTVDGGDRLFRIDFLDDGVGSIRVSMLDVWARHLGDRGRSAAVKELFDSIREPVRPVRMEAREGTCDLVFDALSADGDFARAVVVEAFHDLRRSAALLQRHLTRRGP